MKLKTIFEYLNTISPFEFQEEWDNSGVNVGNLDSEIRKIYISLDLDEEVVDKVDKDSLIITHHPLIFKPIKRVTPNNFTNKLLFKLIQKNISLIAMHTNFDKTHLNNYFAKEILGFEGESEEFVFYSDVFMEFNELVNLVKQKMNLNNLRIVKTKDFIKRVAITTGAGISLINSISADCFLTGDIKYHEAMDAKVRSISLIDIGHFESERYFVDILYDLIDLNIEIEKIYLKNPFELI